MLNNKVVIFHVDECVFSRYICREPTMQTVMQRGIAKYIITV